MLLTKCSNGHYYDKNNYDSCPHCEAKKTEAKEICYVWDSKLMKISQISKFNVRYGDLPIVHVDFNGDELIIYNRINGSRDGWMSFPEGFFDEKKVKLTNQDINNIKDYFNLLNFSSWKTQEYIIKNIVNRPAGFFINESFSCEFFNGVKFYCAYPPKEDFNKLIKFLKIFYTN